MWLVIYKFILGWLLPPGIFILLFAFIAWRMRKKESHEHTVLFYIATVSAILLYVLSNSIFINLLSRGLEKYPPVTSARFSASNTLIVLSGGINENVPVSFSSLHATPSQYGITRLSETARIYREIVGDNLSCKIVVTGGIFPGTAIAESDVYKEWLLSIGIPELDILIERKSRTTFENARYAQIFIQNTKSESVFLVTSAWHMRRSVRAFAAYGMHVIPAPCDFTPPIKTTLLSFVPRAENLSKCSLLLWEYIGDIYYSLKRTTQ